MVLREEGFSRLSRRKDDERPARTHPERASRADVRNFQLVPATFETHVAKTTFLAQYSDPLGRSSSVRLLRGWPDHLRAHLALAGASFNLDFHAVPFFGQDEFVERHYLSKRSRRDKAVLTFIAQDADTDVLCCANADLRKGDESDEVLRHFFHVDALSSAVAMKVDFDVTLTVIATGLYRLLGKHLHGFEHAQARQIFRRFLDTTARVEVSPHSAFTCASLVGLTTPCCSSPACSRRPSRSPGGEELRSRSRSLDRCQ